ncbi:hypothetical protein PPSIR1_02616 [Plesiocystis pacifica SIR-1]|uniref:Uncharacterized protein n=1 Tax=Plesiocystis pacifica SIR-1 TaxID=391625 RepID=A6G487_9BACT|nr:hypothetical protein PPSIR1_02616 [Plesiocystis pacifica SIR-1]
MKLLRFAFLVSLALMVLTFVSAG